jgi:hypothetical protein
MYRIYRMGIGIRSFHILRILPIDVKTLFEMRGRFEHGCAGYTGWELGSGVFISCKSCLSMLIIPLVWVCGENDDVLE